MKALFNQAGLATLTITIILLLTMTLLVMSSARTSLVETRIAGNEYRTIEASHAADAGLEFAIAWLGTNAWANGESSPGAPSIAAGSNETYNITLAFTATGGDLIDVLATATAASDSSINATSTQLLRQTYLLKPDVDINPLMVNGCIDNITGNPDIYPANWNSAGSVGDAIATSQSDNPAGSCIDTGHFETHGGGILDEAFSGTAWDKLFDVTKAEFQTLSDTEATAVASGEMAGSERSYYWVNDTSNWHTSLGSPSHPVFLIFSTSADCPKLNGNPTIYGVVYVDGGCPDGAQGWGGAEVYGGVVMEGDLAKFNANTELHDWSDSGSSNDDITNPPIGAARLSGSWKDW